MKALYEFYCDYNYGELVGLFISDTEDVKDCIGRAVCFGEVLGKHSEVEFDLEECMLREITRDLAEISQVTKILGKSFPMGYNPIDTIIEREGL